METRNALDELLSMAFLGMFFIALLAGGLVGISG